jgi:hypothetical protein
MQRIVLFIVKLTVRSTCFGTIMPIIRSSKVIQMAAACGTWFFGLQVVGLMWNCGLCVHFAGYFSTEVSRKVDT